MARSGVIYGPTGSFKTTAVAHFAHWIAETTGKATRLFTASAEGGWAPCEEEILAGMITPYKCNVNAIPLPIMRRISQGFWPLNPEEPDIAKVNFSLTDWSQIGGIAVEGITSLGTMLLRHCADKNLKTGQEGTSSFKQPINVDGEIQWEEFVQNSKGHFGFVQNQLYSLISNFTSLPVSYVLFTGHEKRYTDDGELQVGIAAPGKAITPLIPTWIGDCLHAQDYKVPVKIRVNDATKPDGYREEETVEVRCRYYFKKHPDPQTGAIFEAKPRVSHSKVEALHKLYPGGYFEPTPDHGFDEYLRVMDRLAQDAAQSDALKNWRGRMDEKLGRAKPALVGAKA